MPFADSFDRMAPTWDRDHGPASPRAPEFAARRRLLRALCRRLRRPRVLDLGCGTGQTLVHLADLVTAGRGVDQSPAMIARAVANAAAAPDRLRFEVAEIDSFAAGEAFDLVLLIGVLEHLPDPQRTLARIGGMLAPHGRIVVIMPDPRSRAVRRAGASGALGTVPVRLLSPRRLSGLAAPHGLSLETLRSLPFAPLPAAPGNAYAAALRHRP